MADFPVLGFPFPVFGNPPTPTWQLYNADTPIELPLIGQFDPEVKESNGKPIWSKKPGIGGGQPWLKYVGKDNAVLEFTFHCIAVNQLDQYPAAALKKLQELAEVDSELGRPPRVYFVYGFKIVEAYITELPESFPTRTWFKSSIIREVGPVQVILTPIPTKKVELSIGTNYVPRTENTLFEELSRTQYGDARYAHALDEVNQNVQAGETLELPRKSDTRLVKIVDLAPALSDEIEGL